ncbi:hypothetical protein [Armatimonas sp.]|uniref:hypothetical protein n=1 Tax=Armatimonas sp. TaxID=1872638 RepID=UPI0037525113
MFTLSNNWNATIGNDTIYEDPGTNLKLAGTFNYTINAIATSKRIIKATGTDWQGGNSTIVAQAEYISNDSASLTRYALLAKSYIGFGGNSSISTSPLNSHNADARTNGYISQGGSSSVDGTLFATGTISGSGYYLNQPGYSEIAFPTEDQLVDFETSWKAAALLGTTYNPNSFSNNQTIAAPAYINGNITLTGNKTLTITGSGVVYVNGSVDIKAQTRITNSATFIIRDTFTCNGQAYYTIPAGALTPSSGVFTATMISLNGDMQLNGGGDATGIVYCARGNMRVNGGAIYRGSLIAGGYIETVGTYDQIYPGTMSSNINFPIPLRLTKFAEP